MKKFMCFAGFILALAGPVMANPLDAVSRNVDRNGGLELITGGDGKTYAVNEDRDVFLGDGVIGSTNGRAGTKANDNSVVGPYVSGGCTGSTRVDLPGTDGSGC